MICKYLFLLFIFITLHAHAQTPRVVDVPSRAGVTQRFLLLQPENAKAAVILFAGGDGGLQMSSDGAMKALRGNFLVRSRDLFAAQGLAVAVIDAPSDRQSFPHLNNFRQTPEHVVDVKAAIAWLRQELKMPVWLVGTSRGTQSAAFIATQLTPADGGPDGIVLTSSVLADNRSRPVPGMALERIHVPVLVTHHRQDSCRACRFSDLPMLTNKLKHIKKTETLIFDGGDNVGDPCEARAYHGYNGIEADVVEKISAWVKTN
ncbi:MAG: alpha/beta hydrolase [Burkholderiales bacterium]